MVSIGAHKYMELHVVYKKRKLVGKFYQIFRGYLNKNLHFHVTTLSKSTCDKTLAKKKSVALFPKSFFLTSKRRYAIHFFLAACEVCHLAIPEFAYNKGIRLLAAHSLLELGTGPVGPISTNQRGSFENSRCLTLRAF